MKVLLIDDLREPGTNGIPVLCSVARTYKEGLALLCAFDWDELYLDHDLGDFEGGRERTGYDILVWLETYKELAPKKIILVTSNAAVLKKMNQAIENIYKI